MTKDSLIYSSQEILFGLSGAKKFCGWTHSPLEKKMLAQVFQDIYYSSIQR